MKSPNKPDVLEERLTSLFERGVWSYQIPPDYTIVEQAKQEILNWHKSQVKELVEELKSTSYNGCIKLETVEALIDKLGEDK